MSNREIKTRHAISGVSRRIVERKQVVARSRPQQLRGLMFQDLPPEARYFRPQAVRLFWATGSSEENWHFGMVVSKFFLLKSETQARSERRLANSNPDRLEKGRQGLLRVAERAIIFPVRDGDGTNATPLRSSTRQDQTSGPNCRSSSGFAAQPGCGIELLPIYAKRISDYDYVSLWPLQLADCDRRLLTPKPKTIRIRWADY